MTDIDIDIVERLREQAPHSPHWLEMVEAADEIERLRAQVVALQSSLEVGKREGKKTP